MKLKLLSTLLISASVLASGPVFATPHKANSAMDDIAKPAAPAAGTPAPTKVKKAKKAKAAPVAPSNAAQRNNGPLAN